MKRRLAWTVVGLGVCLGWTPGAAQGAGGFGGQNVISTAAGFAECVFATDLDGDGDRDVVSASSNDNKIAWYENLNGLGTFGAQKVISTAASYATSVYATDLDGDGDADVLSASWNDNKIAWYENVNGLGTFGPEKMISTAVSGAMSVFAADLDGDGDADVLSASYGIIAWYENTNGLGAFGAQKVISTAASGAMSVFAADLDGDGDADVLSASYNDAKIAWYENTNGLGTFGPQKVISTAVSLARCVYATDLDGDGDADVLSASANDDKIAWYENANGLGSFGAQKVISNAADGARSVYAGDLDGDGDTDVLSASMYDDKIAWYENTDGLGSFGAQTVISTLADEAHCVFAEDLDGDGDSDVLSASAGDNKIVWYVNEIGVDDFGPDQVVTTLANAARSVHAADVDGDGDRDLLSASSNDDKVAWYENTDGLGAFGPQKVITSGANGACSVFASDLDGDGDTDALSASEYDDTIAWYENTDGLGLFGPKNVISAAANGAWCVLAADVDRDGDADVLSASVVDDKIAWYENMNGAGAFSAEKIVTTLADGARCAFVADVDGDGDLDVLSASSNDDKIAWYQNTNGLGAFGVQQVISTAADYPLSVFAADVDGDGDADVLSASANDDKIAWYENTNGLGAFGPQQVISTFADYALSVFAIDLDGDGDVDVLTASYDDDRIMWYENPNGAGGFGPPNRVSDLADGAWHVCAADLDGDGDPDALSASVLDDKIAWYKNLMGVPQADMGYQGPGDAEIQVWGQALSTGNAATFVLSGALPYALTFLLVSPSFTPTYVWEVGGTLCPILPPLVTLVLATDASGEVDLPGGVPGGSGPASIYVQAACQDAGQPMGFAVTNCVKIDLLP